MYKQNGNCSIPKPKEDDKIEYQKEYNDVLIKEYDRRLGEDGMIYKNSKVIEKQRGIATHMIKNIGINLLRGKSIMNVSLPINIFDTRTILELYVFNNLDLRGKTPILPFYSKRAA